MAKRQTHHGAEAPGIQIEQQEMGTHEMILIAVSVATIALSVALAIAAVKIATGLKWAIIISASGPSGYWILRGIADVTRQYLAGVALIEQARRGVRLELGTGPSQITARITGGRTDD